MFLLIATITASVFAAAQDDGSKDIYARLGFPRLESSDFRIHVGNEGNWTAHLTQEYGIEGVTEEDLKACEEWLFEQACSTWAQSRHSVSNAGTNRRQCEIKGKSEDVLVLASLLVNIFEEDKCDYLQWNRDSFEWRFLRDDVYPSSSDEKKTVGELVAGAAFSFLITAAMNDEFRKKGVTPAQLESAMMEIGKSQLTIMTDGKITADAPAEVSDDGKTLTLDLAKFLSDPPEQWSIRIDGL